MGQWVIRQMKGTTGGDAPPLDGERFAQASKLFQSVDEVLQGAGPNDSWYGSGSDAYADQNTRQQLRSETVSDADREVASVLYREAGQIKLCRSVLDDYHNFLAEVGESTFYLQFIPRYGEAAKMAIELATVNTALTDCTWQLYQLNSAVNENAATLQQAVGRYATVADGAVLTLTDLGGPPPGSGAQPLPPIERSQPRPDTPPNAPSAPADGGSPRNAPPPSAPSEIGGPGAGPVDSAPPATSDRPPMPSLPGIPGMGSPSAAAPGSGGVGPLGSLLGALGGLLTGGQQAADSLPLRPISRSGRRLAQSPTSAPRLRQPRSRPSKTRGRPRASKPRRARTTRTRARRHPASTTPSGRPFTSRWMSIPTGWMRRPQLPWIRTIHPCRQPPQHHRNRPTGERG